MIEWKVEDKQLMDEISTLMGINKSVIQEVFEYQLINLVEKFSRDPLKATTVRLPLIGELYLKYTDDTELQDGSIQTNFNSFISLSDNLKKMLSKTIDESPTDGDSELDNILQEKIEAAIFSSLES